ncbi:hypothetical protein [Longitalea luteola]|nr:hypothetical protein [Longitalea luteola]
MKNRDQLPLAGCQLPEIQLHVGVAGQLSPGNRNVVTGNSIIKA